MIFAKFRSKIDVLGGVLGQYLVERTRNLTFSIVEVTFYLLHIFIITATVNTKTFNNAFLFSPCINSFNKTASQKFCNPS